MSDFQSGTISSVQLDKMSLVAHRKNEIDAEMINAECKAAAALHSGVNSQIG